MSESPGQTVAGSPNANRRKRPTRVGEVLTAMRDKSIKVSVSFQVRHPKYGKYLRRRTVLHAHDEKNGAGVGDVVEITECRPLSKTKNWRLLRVIRKSLTSR